MADNMWLAIVAVANLGTASLAFLTFIITRQTRNAVMVVEKATNSLTDRLVKTTGEQQYAAGRKDEKSGVADRSK